MKKILLALSLIVAGFNYSKAQEVMLDSVSSGFRDIYSVMDGQFYYTFYKTDKPDSKTTTLNLAAYTRELNLVKKTKLEIPKDGNVIASAFSNNTYLLFIGDENKKTCTRIALDIDGKIIKKTEEKVSSSFFKFENLPRIINAMPEGFIVITPAVVNKSQGYKLERLEKNMDSKWTKTFASENGADWSIINVYAVMERIIILRKEQNGKAVGYAMHTIQGDQGESMMTTPLAEGQDICAPTFYKTKDDYGAIGGMMYNQSAPNRQAGIFANIMGPAGDIQKSAKLTFDKIADGIDAGTLKNITAGKAGLYVHDALRVPAGYTLVCELYSRTSSGRESHFNTGDFIFIELNEEGQYVSAMQQPQKPRAAIVKGIMADMDDVDLGQWLSKNHFFSYKVGSHMKMPAVLYQEDDTATSLKVINIRDTMRKVAPGAPVNHIKLTPPAVYVYENPFGETNFPRSNAMQTGREMTLIYQYSRPKLAIWFQPGLMP